MPVTLLDEQLVVVRLGTRSRASRTCACIAGRRCRWAGSMTGRSRRPTGVARSASRASSARTTAGATTGTGVVRRIPAVHGRSIPNRARVARYATADAVGLVWVLLEPGSGRVGGTRAPPIPSPRRIRGGSSRASGPSRSTPTTGPARRPAGSRTSSTSATSRGSTRASSATDRSRCQPEHEVIDDGVTISFDIALEEPQARVKGDVAPGAKVQRDPTTYTLHLPLSVTLDQRLPPSADRPGQPLPPVPRLLAAVRAALPLVHLERAHLQPRARERRRARRLPGLDPRPGPPDRRVAAARGAPGRPLSRAAHRGAGSGVDRVSAAAGGARPSGWVDNRSRSRQATLQPVRRR